MNTEHLSGMTKALLAAQLGAASAAWAAGLNGLARLNHLNASTAAATISEGQVMWQTLLSAPQSEQAMALINAQWKPSLQKALSYGRHINGISNEVQEGLRQAALQQVAGSREQLEQLARARMEGDSLPAGSLETLASLVDSQASMVEQLAEANRHQCQALQASLDALLEQWQQGAAQA